MYFWCYFHLSNSQDKICNRCLFFNGFKAISKSDLCIVALLSDGAKAAIGVIEFTKLGPCVSVSERVCSLNPHNETETLTQLRLPASWFWTSNTQLIYDSPSGDSYIASYYYHFIIIIIQSRISSRSILG